jgi:4-aminobutyrate aminotransferase
MNPTAAKTGLSPEEVRAKHKELLFPNIANYYKKPLVLDRAAGLSVWDVEGREYLDFFGGILTVSVGHCHPRVVSAIAEQAKRLGHTSTLYQNEAMVSFAERMSRLTPIERKDGRAPKVFFTNSGSEADETALVTARLFTGSNEVMALRYGYSGRTAVGMTLTAHAGWRHWGEGVPGIKHTVQAYCYRCPFGLKYPSCEVKCARDLEEKIKTETSGEIAATLVEPIQGVGGVITPPKEFHGILAEITRRHGGLFISDEVQTGFGRTGRHWNGIEHWGVKPDLMTFAKGAANGMPIGITVARADVADAFSGSTISTFGGNPVTMAAAAATLDVMVEEKIPERAERLGARFRAGLDGLAAKHRLIGEVRGLGLMQGIELVKDRATQEPAPVETTAFLEAAKDEGLLIGKGGLYGNVIRLSPPMTASERQVDDAVEMLDRALGSVGKVAGS